MRPLIKAVNFLFNAVGISEIGAKYDSELDRNREGWTDIQPSPDLHGWVRQPAARGSELPATSPWTVQEDGRLVCSPDAQYEVLRLDRELDNFVFHVEWRSPTQFEPSLFYPGIFTRMSPDGEYWHAATIGSENSGHMLAYTKVAGRNEKINLSFQLERQHVRGAGWWNIYEIHSNRERIRTWVNDGWTCDLHKVEVPSGYIAIAAIPGGIEYRNLSIRPIN